MTPPLPFVGTGRFELRTLLGEGSTGSVYQVHDRETSRVVALKTLRLPANEALFRLKREFRTRAGLSHPNLLQLYELFADDTLCFFTMEALEGVDFLHWTRGSLGLGGLRGSTQECSTAASTGDLSPEPLPASATSSPPCNDAGTSIPDEPPSDTWERLHRALVQLLQGLQALHAAGLVHRDVKPSNVLVTPQERVVLLDFGLTTALDGPEPSRPRRLAGTPAYMAPEQITGAPVTPAADLYAVGAMLYEVLTGAPPFSSLDGNLLEHKVRRPPPHVLELAPLAPQELASLTMDLLALAPEQRPGASACLARLAPGSAPSPLSLDTAGPTPLFVGRAPELEALSQALADSRHLQVTLHLHGSSGIGTSSLVRHFLSSTPSAPVVLHGRCHPQERIPYKALDAVIDALARHLESLPASHASARVPPRASALARLFPVLRRLASFQSLPPLLPLPDAAELRRQGGLALRELLEHLARERPLVLWVDDAQWGDVDSAFLFEELLRPPAPPLLLLLSWRTEDRGSSPLLRRLLTLAPPDERASVRELALGALPPHEVGALASALLGADAASPQVRAVISQAEGNPFIARELALHAGLQSSPEAHVDVARLVVARIRSLPDEQRALLEVAALAGRPLARGIALQAAGLDAGGRLLVASLRDSGLLREVPGEDEPALGAYHDRIREALLDALPDEARARRHRAIAEALTARGSEDDEALLLHWEGAGEPLRAGHHAVRSADRAAQALAFENAASLYRKALALLGPQADRPSLLEKLADALAHLGQAPEAAQRYLEAADALGGCVEHPGKVP